MANTRQCLELVRVNMKFSKSFMHWNTKYSITLLCTSDWRSGFTINQPPHVHKANYKYILLPQQISLLAFNMFCRLPTKYYWRLQLTVLNNDIMLIQSCNLRSAYNSGKVGSHKEISTKKYFYAFNNITHHEFHTCTGIVKVNRCLLCQQPGNPYNYYIFHQNPTQKLEWGCRP
jgi:hypothetical protein